LHALIRHFLIEYEQSATRHVALLNDTKFLAPAQRDVILDRQRNVVSAFTRFLQRAYGSRMNADNATPITMMLFGMMNWTFTWLKAGGPLSYAQFADEVIQLLERGMQTNA
ncbi:MAG: hypothetical protein RL357_683, partial [Pseudomonadota bacterium]